MRWLITSFCIFLTCLGCGSQTEVKNPDSDQAQEELAFIRKTLADQLGVPEKQLKNDVPLGNLDPPMDENALVNLVMAIEAEYDVTLPEAALLESDEPNQHHLMLEQNTLNSLAAITHKQRHSPTPVE